jgi:hypothetical protein
MCFFLREMARYELKPSIDSLPPYRRFAGFPIRYVFGLGRSKGWAHANNLAVKALLLYERNRRMRRTGKMKKLILATALAFTIVGTRPASAQDPTDEDIKLFRKDLRSMRKQIIAANMNLSDKEAEQFWPVFERYTQELVAKQDEKYALLKEYAQDYLTMTDAEAEKYIRGRASVDQAILEVRLKYFPLFRKVLSGKATALFFQLDWRLGLLMDLQLASQTPVIEP